jgi:hypothetical protein
MMRLRNTVVIRVAKQEPDRSLIVLFGGSLNRKRNYVFMVEIRTIHVKIDMPFPEPVPPHQKFAAPYYCFQDKKSKNVEAEKGFEYRHEFKLMKLIEAN